MVRQPPEACRRRRPPAVFRQRSISRAAAAGRCRRPRRQPRCLQQWRAPPAALASRTESAAGRMSRGARHLGLLGLLATARRGMRPNSAERCRESEAARVGSNVTAGVARPSPRHRRPRPSRGSGEAGGNAGPQPQRCCNHHRSRSGRRRPCRRRTHGHAARRRRRRRRSCRCRHPTAALLMGRQACTAARS
eukprot:366466-Chlamydomonas_euryale.AAC.13